MTSEDASRSAPLPRFHAPELPSPGETVDLPAEEARHAAGPLRLCAGDGIELFDGSGRLAAARVETLSRSGLRATVLAVREEPAGTPALTLATAIPKGKRRQVLVEKCTELGAARFQPVAFRRSVTGSVGDPEKWRRWALEACKQCRRAHVPTLADARPLVEFLSDPGPGRLFLADREGIPAREWTASVPYEAPITILIGPEGGLDSDEIRACEAAGAARVSLGPHLLRVETACMAACALLGPCSAGGC